MSTAFNNPPFYPTSPSAARPSRWGALAALALAGAIGGVSWQARVQPLAADQAIHPPGVVQAPTSQHLKSLDSGARQLRFEPNRGQTAADVRYLARTPQQQVAIFDNGMAFTALRPSRSPDTPAGVGAAAQPDTNTSASTSTSASTNTSAGTNISTTTAQLRLINARRGGAFVEAEALPSRSHHLIGRDANQWQRALPQFKQLRYAQAYPGIDLVYYSREGEFEFDFVVMPGADPRQIRLNTEGAAKPVINAQGELLLDGQAGLLRIKKPVLYQHIDGQKVALDARWVLAPNGELSFALPAYDKRHVLVIDPVFKLLHSTYLGGVHDDQVGGLVLDAQGNAYIVGNSGSEDWPVSGNAYQTRRKNLGSYVRNVVVTKFDAAGTLLWSTFIGGSVNDYGSAIAIDAAGQVVVTGYTNSQDFPTTAGAHQNTLRGGKSGFVAVLSPDGSALVQSTLYGGNGGADANSLVLDAGGNVVVGGNAGPGLTTTTGAYKTTLATGNAAYVARFGPSTGGPMQLLAATYYGTDTPENNSGVTGNLHHAMALDASGAPWITGQAYTTRLPTTANALQTAPTEIDLACRIGVAPLHSFAYLAKLSADLKTLQFASYLSGKLRVPGQQICDEYPFAIKIDAAGDLYLHGATGSDKFPTTAGTPQPAYPGNNGFTGYSGFVAKIKGDVPRVLWSTFIGGNGGNTFAGRMALDAGTGSLWLPLLTGGGTNFPITADAQQKTFGGGSYDAALVQMDAATGAIKYSSFMGGSADDFGVAVAIDGGGNAFVAGTTSSRDFAVTGNAYQPTYTVGAFDGTDWFFRIVGSGTIGRVRPSTAGNAGDVTMTIGGAGFQAQSTCALAGQGQTLAALQVYASADGSQLTCSFALAGVAIGAYDVVVNHPDGSSLRRPGGFTITAGSGSDVAVEVLGRPAIRTGVPSTYQVVVTNAGDADAIGVVLVVRYSKGLKPVDPSKPDPFNLGLIPIPPLKPSDTEDYSKNPVVRASTIDPGASVVSLILPVVAAGASSTFSFSLLAATDSLEEYVEAFVYDALVDKQSSLAASALAWTPEQQQMRRALSAAVQGGNKQPQGLSKECLDEIWKQVWEKASGKIPGVDCFRDFERSIFELKRYQLTHPANQGALLGDVAKSLFKNATDCAQLAGLELAAAIEAVKRFLDIIEDAEKLAQISDKCKDKDKDKDKKKKKQSKKKTKAQGSNDPNDKSGPIGDDSSAHWIQRAAPMSYQIAFENKPTAGLPAADVVVTDQLDPSKVDLSTLTLGNISWGPYRIDVPAGLNSYSTIFPINTAMSVRVAGSLNPSTGLLKWTFTTLDPVTKLPPSDPTLGFLPPNKNGTEGQGYVNFTVSPKTGLGDGTRWENFASIVFDRNAAILTPTWVNTLDTTAPFSRVATVAQKATGTDLDVTWSGSDAGSGVRRYTVYVSDNGGAFTAWQSNVSSTAATYTGGVIGHTYGFNVVATDGAGNVEVTRLTADASALVRDTTVVPPPPPPPASGGGGGCSIASGGDQRDGSLPLLLAAAGVVLVWRRRCHGKASMAKAAKARLPGSGTRLSVGVK